MQLILFVAVPSVQQLHCCKRWPTDNSSGMDNQPPTVDIGPSNPGLISAQPNTLHISMSICELYASLVRTKRCWTNSTLGSSVLSILPRVRKQSKLVLHNQINRQLKVCLRIQCRICPSCTRVTIYQ